MKEYRIDRIVQCVSCIEKSAFNREKQRDCILALYQNKKTRSPEDRDQSIFRGMAILSLRKLGLIVGYGYSIKVSANGKLLTLSKSLNSSIHNRVQRSLILEIDKEDFGFLDSLWDEQELLVQVFTDSLYRKIEIGSPRRKRETVAKWLSILKQVKLLREFQGKIGIIRTNAEQSLCDSDSNLKDLDIFRKIFLETYFELGKKSAGVVDIATLRESCCTRLLKEEEAIVTEKQFDELLRKNLPNIGRYVISLGKAMASGEKLFEYRGNYFRTILLKVNSRERDG